MVVQTVEEATRLSKGVDFAQRLLRLTTQYLSAIVEANTGGGVADAPDAIAATDLEMGLRSAWRVRVPV